MNDTPTVPSALTCQSCGLPTATRHVTLYENVGLLVMRFHRSVSGNLCRSCIDRYFWDFTGKTFLLGWWGVISFVLTPFIILNNSFVFLRTRGLARAPVQLGPGPSALWVFATVAGFVGTGFLASAIVLGLSGPTATRTVAEEECAIKLLGYETYIILTGHEAQSSCNYAVSKYSDTFVQTEHPARSPVICSEDIESLHAVVVDSSASGEVGAVACKSLYSALGTSP